MPVDNKNIIILIPAYHPDRNINEICRKLTEKNYREIVVVSDGNEEKGYKEILDETEAMGVTVLRHSVNQGKGRALKTGINYINLKYVEELDLLGVLTIDADGQHTMASIQKCEDELKQCLNSNKWVFGSRNFSECVDENGNVGKVPFRSRFGNEVTKFVLRWACGIRLADTQTGLRGFPGKYLKELLAVEGERYEYEMNQILYAKDSGVQFAEISIETVYDRTNSSSHFNPIVDSWRIYRPVLRYTGSSILAVLVEYIIFAIAIGLGNGIMLSNYVARFFSAGVNFYTNKKFVFKSRGNLVFQLVGYIMLCVIAASISAWCISFIKENWEWNVIVAKAVIDTLLYFVNYVVQSTVIFRKRNN